MTLELAIPELSVASPALSGLNPVTGKFQGAGAYDGELAMPKKSAEERFWDKVDKTEGCWLWKDAPDQCGYGRIWSLNERKTILAHRFAYELLVGPIPKGLTIDHLCRVRMCVNPKHLEPVTMCENSRRGFSPPAVNARKTHCPQGHPYDEKNTYLTPGGARTCRVCNRAAVKKLAAKKLERRSP